METIAIVKLVVPGTIAHLGLGRNLSAHQDTTALVQASIRLSATLAATIRPTTQRHKVLAPRALKATIVLQVR